MSVVIKVTSKSQQMERTEILMSTFLSTKEETSTPAPVRERPFTKMTRWLLNSWEIYPILLIAIFFHFFNLSRTLLVDDQAGDFQRAYNAVAHGLWPITGNVGSLNYVHPTLSIYFFMLPAAISSNPLGGEILVALVNTVAVVLTYYFVRRYYGRLAGTIAALLYTSNVIAWSYSRDIWSPNFVPFFVILFFFALFSGVIDRRKGWLFPALVLLGVLYQLHESSILLGVCLVVAVIFAFKTIRLRDIFYAFPVLLLLFAPYLLWEVQVHFVDIIGSFASSPSIYVHNFHGFDLEALRMYAALFNPKISIPYANISSTTSDNHLILSGGQTILLQNPLRHFQLFLRLAFPLMILVFLGAVVLLTLYVLSPQQFAPASQSSTLTNKRGLSRWWNALYASPERQGIALLLLWQLIPLLYLLHHTILLYEHYILFLLPGPFILVAVGLIKSAELIQRLRPDWKRLVSYAICSLAALLIGAQLLGTTVSLVDQTTGRIPPNTLYARAQYNNLASLQNALQEADQLARQHHIHRIYGIYNPTLNKSIKYLSEFIQTPIALYDPGQCMVLPSPTASPALLLTIGETPFQDVLLKTYADATLLAQPERLGYPDSPFQIYLVTTKPLPAPVPQTFTQRLQALSSSAQVFQSVQAKASWLVTRWRVLDTHLSTPLTTYNYNFQAQPGNEQSNCSLTATWAGDQIFAFHRYALDSTLPSQITVQASTSATIPELLHWGPLTLETSYTEDISTQTLLTASRQNSLTFAVQSA